MSPGWLVGAVLAALLVGAVATAVRLRAERATLHRGIVRTLVTLEELGVASPSGPSSPHAGTSGAVVAQLDRALAETVERTRRHEVRIDRLAMALDAISPGVIVVNKHGSIVFRNQNGAALDDARHGDALVRAAVVELLDEARRGVHGERTLDLYGPPRRTLVVTTTPLQTDVEIKGAVAVIEDVSERRRTDAVRRDFVANISHELKTPIGAISLLAETMLGESEPGIRDRLAGRLVDEADRVNRTIDDLLVLSRIEHDEQPRREPVPVDLVVAEALDRCRSGADQRDVHLVVEDPDPRLAVFGDRRQLVSALHNLLDNAVKYSEPGAEVSVRAGTDGRSVDIVVEDHGIGIPTRDLERIFERFYRVDQGRSRQTGGTGLGLAIVRHVVSNHGGEVRVESRLGEGSTFTLWLPSASGPVALRPHEASA